MNRSDPCYTSPTDDVSSRRQRGVRYDYAQNAANIAQCGIGHSSPGRYQPGHPPSPRCYFLNLLLTWGSGVVVARWSRSTKSTYTSGPVSTAMGDRVQVQFPVRDIYLGKPGQLSLAIPSWVGTMSTSQRAVTPCGPGVKAGMVRVWVAGKTVIPLIVTHGPYI